MGVLWIGHYQSDEITTETVIVNQDLVLFLVRELSPYYEIKARLRRWHRNFNLGSSWEDSIVCSSCLLKKQGWTEVKSSDLNRPLQPRPRGTGLARSGLYW